MKMLLIAAAGGLLTLGACSDAQDRAEERLDDQAEASAAQAGSDIVALGLTESQLLDADLIGSSGTDLGDVDAVLRNASGKVDRLIVKLSGPDPQRYVEISTSGLGTGVQGGDMNVITTMGALDLDALPAATLPPA